MIRFPEPAVWYRQATVGLALVILAGTGCSAEHSSTGAGDLSGTERTGDERSADTQRRIAGIVTTAYDPAVAAADGVAAARLPIKVVAIDDDAKVLSGIRSGGIAATVVQNPAGQAYVGGWLLALLGSKQCQFRTPGLVIDSGSFVVTSANVDSYDAERDAWTRQLQKNLGVELACR
jgi:ribose transport system substrate-binding protein